MSCLFLRLSATLLALGSLSNLYGVGSPPREGVRHRAPSVENQSPDLTGKQPRNPLRSTVYSALAFHDSSSKVYPGDHFSDMSSQSTGTGVAHESLPRRSILAGYAGHAPAQKKLVTRSRIALTHPPITIAEMLEECSGVIRDYHAPERAVTAAILGHAVSFAASSAGALATGTLATVYFDTKSVIGGKFSLFMLIGLLGVGLYIIVFLSMSRLQYSEISALRNYRRALDSTNIVLNKCNAVLCALIKKTPSLIKDKATHPDDWKKLCATLISSSMDEDTFLDDDGVRPEDIAKILRATYAPQTVVLTNSYNIPMHPETERSWISFQKKAVNLPVERYFALPPDQLGCLYKALVTIEALITDHPSDGVIVEIRPINLIPQLETCYTCLDEMARTPKDLITAFAAAGKIGGKTALPIVDFLRNAEECTANLLTLLKQDDV